MPGLCLGLGKKYTNAKITIEYSVLFYFRESLHDIITLLRNSPKQNAEKILSVMKKWAKENRINL